MSQNDAATIELDGEEYTEERLTEISDWWEQKATEALQKDDDWGYEQAREKMMKAENAKKELRQNN